MTDRKGSIELPTTGPAQTLWDDLSLEIVRDESRDGAWKVVPGDIQVLDVKEVSDKR